MCCIVQFFLYYVLIDKFTFVGEIIKTNPRKFTKYTCFFLQMGV